MFLLRAILPFLVAQKNLSYEAAAGLVFAENFVQSLIQPLFGHYADRLSKPWFTNYWALFASVAVSAIGIAAFHPQGARLANQVQSMSQNSTGLTNKPTAPC